MLRFEGSDALTASVVERDPDGGVALAFNLAGAAFADALKAAGALALPPYIDRPPGPPPPPVSEEARRRGEELARTIEDEGLRTLVARAAAVSLSRSETRPDDRPL